MRIIILSCTDGDRIFPCAVDLDAIVGAIPADVDGWTKISAGDSDWSMSTQIPFDEFVKLWSQGKAMKYAAKPEDPMTKSVSVEDVISPEPTPQPEKKLAQAGKGLLLPLAKGTDARELENRSFQIHVHRGLADTLTLYEVRVHGQSGRCPVIIGGEQCGDVAGHDGKHAWGRGD